LTVEAIDAKLEREEIDGRRHEREEKEEI